MANQLGVSRNTVVSAYDQLIGKGYLVSRKGSRCWVANTGGIASATKPFTKSVNFPKLSVEGAVSSQQPFLEGEPEASIFHPGLPETSAFPHKTWGAILKRLSAHSRKDLHGYHSIAGHFDLKKTLASYLTVSRGLKCAPENIILTTGAQAALDIIARLLVSPGETVWMADPGFFGARNAFTCAGASLVSLPVDQTGWQLPTHDVPDPNDLSHTSLSACFRNPHAIGPTSTDTVHSKRWKCLDH